MKTFKERPADGGSYLQNPDGTYTQLEAPTAPCPRKSDVAATTPATEPEPARQTRTRKPTEEA